MHMVSGGKFGVCASALAKIFVQIGSAATGDCRKKRSKGAATSGGNGPSRAKRRVHCATVGVGVGFMLRGRGHGFGYAQTEAFLINAGQKSQHFRVRRATVFTGGDNSGNVYAIAGGASCR